MNFIKMHGLGNDFAIVDNRNGLRAFTKDQVVALCNRRTGIGCDQFIVVETGKIHPVFMRIYNPDGSEAESCGNATRCVAYLLMWESGKAETVIETAGGVLECVKEYDGRITIDMGEPKLGWKEIPLSREVDTISIPVAGGQIEAVAVNMGNPHAVIFVDNVEGLDVKKLGASLEIDPIFPKRANIEFVEVKNDGELRMRVWERGAGETLACGSGACAAAVAAIRRNLVKRRVRVILDGGPLDIAWREGDGHVLMTGPVAHVFDGTLKNI